MDKKEYQRKIASAKAVATEKINKSKIKKMSKGQIVTCILMIFWSVASVLGVFGFARSFKNKNMEIVGASAYSGTTSNPVPRVFTFKPQGLVGASFVQTFYYNNQYRVNSYSLSPLEFRLDVENKTFSVRYNDYDTWQNSSYAYDDMINFNDYTSLEFYPYCFSPTAFGGNSYDLNSYMPVQPSVFSIDFSAWGSNATPDIPIGYALERVLYTCEELDGNYIWIDFEFSNGVDTIAWHARLWCDSNMVYTCNQYPYLPFFGKVMSVGTTYVEYVKQFNYENLDSAYNEGYSDSLDRIEQLEREKANAYQNGYNAGYQVGLDDTHPYSFGNLLSSVIDVPIQAFTNLLNFEILGVNLLVFAESLLFVALLLAVIKILI